MAKLSEILGGIAKDITQAQMTSDLVTLEYVQQFQQDPLLKLMPVPRVRIRDIQVNLKFSIQEAESSPISNNAIRKVGALWGNQIETTIIPRLISSWSNDSKAQRSIAQLFEQGKKVVASPDFSRTNIMNAELSGTLKSTEQYVTELLKQLPTSIRKNLPSLTEIKKQINVVAREALVTSLPQLKKVAVAQSVEDFDLDIVIEQEALKTLPDSQIHEISVSLDFEEPLFEQE